MTNVSPYTLLEEIDNVPACPFCKEIAWKQEWVHGDPCMQCDNCRYRITACTLLKLEGTTFKEDAKEKFRILLRQVLRENYYQDIKKYGAEVFAIVEFINLVELRLMVEK